MTIKTIETLESLPFEELERYADAILKEIEWFNYKSEITTLTYQEAEVLMRLNAIYLEYLV